MTASATAVATPKGPVPAPSCTIEQASAQSMPNAVAPASSGTGGPLGPPTLTLLSTPDPSHGRVAEMRALTFDVAALAETVTDIERVRIAAENRHRSWVQAGLGDEPVAKQAKAIVDDLAKVEHQATLAVQRAMRRHPLGPFVRGTVGLGEKQAARLVAATGDPYWNTLHDRHRTVSELWAYCGFHVLHPDHRVIEPQGRHVGVEPSQGSHPGQGANEAHGTGAGVAARRRKGQKANWSNEAKMRARLCAESCIKHAHSPYRATYDAGRAKYADRGLTPLHEHNRALRLVAKAILRDLWLEAKAWHEATPPQADPLA